MSKEKNNGPAPAWKRPQDTLETSDFRPLDGSRYG
jgi:hypothetical protein